MARPKSYRMGLAPIRAHDDLFVVLATFRYALGRRSYAPGLVMDWIRERKDFLTDELRNQIAREAREYADLHGDGGMDYCKEWRAFADAIVPNAPSA